MGSNLEWEYIKKQHDDRCALCGSKENVQKAHIVAKSKGGTQLMPLCAKCHLEYDQGEFGWFDRWKLGLDSDAYKKGKYGPR